METDALDPRQFFFTTLRFCARLGELVVAEIVANILVRPDLAGQPTGAI
jgi:hypothetical protein